MSFAASVNFVKTASNELGGIRLRPGPRQDFVSLEKGAVLGKGMSGLVTEYGYTDATTGGRMSFALKENLYVDVADREPAVRALDSIDSSLLKCEVVWFAKNAEMYKTVDGVRMYALYTLMETLKTARAHPSPVTGEGGRVLFNTFGNFLLRLVDCIQGEGFSYSDLKLDNIGYTVCPDSSNVTTFRLFDLDSLDRPLNTYGFLSISRIVVLSQFQVPDREEVAALIPPQNVALGIDMDIAAAVTLFDFADIAFRSHPQYSTLVAIYKQSPKSLTPNSSLDDLSVKTPGNRFAAQVIAGNLSPAQTNTDLRVCLNDVLVDFATRFTLLREWCRAADVDRSADALLEIALQGIGDFRRTLIAGDTTKFTEMPSAVEPRQSPSPSPAEFVRRAVAEVSSDSSVYNHTLDQDIGSAYIGGAAAKRDRSGDRSRDVASKRQMNDAMNDRGWAEMFGETGSFSAADKRLESLLGLDSDLDSLV